MSVLGCTRIISSTSFGLRTMGGALRDLVRKTWRMNCAAQRTNANIKVRPPATRYTNLIRTFYCLIYYLGMSGTSRTGSQTVVQVSQGWFGFFPFTDRLNGLVWVWVWFGLM